MTPPGFPKQDELEQLIGRALKEQPFERAPRALEARVLARIDGRAAHSRFTAWPLAARAAFLLGTGVSAALLPLAWPWLASHLASVEAHALITDRLAGIRTSAGGLIAVARLLWRLCRAVPRDWLYESLLAATAVYALLFGLAAALYRTAGGAAAPEAHRS
ncbi:MAG: hypothetical protein ACRETB_10360 [Steroidobacteraceae bacterium]